MARKPRKPTPPQTQQGQNPPPARDNVAPPAAPPASAEPAEGVRNFFKPEDWWAALATTLVSGLIFFYYMAPEVTLQDSGELVTGAFTFGVPHPPGYPLWAFLGFLWSHLIVPFGNPAWRLGTLSAFTGAMTVGILTLTMTRSLRLLLRSLPWAERDDDRIERWIALTVGVSAALLFGFNPGVWLWACVSEMRVLNQFSFVLMTCTFLAWMNQPHRRGFLYWTLLLYGLSIANHQTVAVMAVPFAAGALAVGLEGFFAQQRTKPGRPFWPTFMTSLGNFWELSTAGALAGLVGLSVLSWLLSTSAKESYNSALSAAIISAIFGMAGLIAGQVTGWWNARRSLLFAGLFLAGAAFYIYMPLAAATNPPMNWAYAATKEGFWHAIRRGQYEQLQTAHVFSDEFLLKINVFGQGVMHQYSWVICLFGLVTLGCMAWGAWRRFGASRQIEWILLWSFAGGLPLLLLAKHLMKETGSFWIVVLWDIVLTVGIYLVTGAWNFFKPRGRAWMIFLWAAFLSTSLGLLIIINPKLDRQEQEITIKFFAPAHGFFAMLIGYGIAVLLSLLARRAENRKSLLLRLLCVALLVLPVAVLVGDWIWTLSKEKGMHDVLAGLCAWAAGIVVAGLAALPAISKGAISLVAARCFCVAALALPLITFQRNWELCALRGHDFGYLFGYLMFNPGGGYPPMEKDAVLYGGTDPGRFVPTYMIFCESRVSPNDRFHDKNFDRSDVYIITQNALADATYMCYIRDHYDLSRPNADRPETIERYPSWRQWVFKLGWKWLDRAHTYPPEPIHIPTADDSNRGFQEYIHDVQTGKAVPNAEIKFENGRVTIQGAGGVMIINGILAKWIFERNKDKHAFYIEESYVIPWMYPYLRPHGVIMKIDKEPLPDPREEKGKGLWAEIVARDRAYWDKLSAEFLARPEFVRSNDAKKSFSKMRAAIAGLYGARGMIAEAEYAFRQSLQLCPESPESNFRLAELYMRLGRFADARTLIENYQKLDVYNANVRNFLNSVNGVERDHTRRQELEKEMAKGKVDINAALELAAIYQRLNMDGPFLGLTRQIMDTTNVPPNVYIAVAQLYANARRWDLFILAARRYLQVDPRNHRCWIELAFGHLMLDKTRDAMDAIRQAVNVGGETARAVLREDKRFAPLYPSQEFQKLVVPSRQPFNLNPTQSGGNPAQRQLPGW